MVTNYVVIFFISLLCIILELFFTRILNLKTWNHVVYIIIPFAILGYGVGANLYFIFSDWFKKIGKNKIFALCLLLTAFFSIGSTLALIYFPVGMMNVFKFFTSLSGPIMLSITYGIVILPFIVIGLLVNYLFYQEPSQNYKLYFFDLLGAGGGRIYFFR